jgi:PAS domain S-box-containing protein
LTLESRGFPEEPKSPSIQYGIAEVVFKYLPAAWMMLDGGGTIIQCNKLCLEIFGANKPEALVKSELNRYLSAGSSRIEFPIKTSAPYHASIQRLDGRVIPVRIMISPCQGGLTNSLAVIIDQSELYQVELLQAYKDQQILNQIIGEILEISRTFSLHLNLDRVMNQIVRVVSESLGYGTTGIYLKDDKNNRMRVATYTNKFLSPSIKVNSNPGLDWDLLQRICDNPANLMHVGGKRLNVVFGGDLLGIENVEKRIPSGAVGNLWQLDELILAIVHIEGSLTNGYIRVNHPLEKFQTGSLLKTPPADIEQFRLQALWIFASQAAVAVENAILFEKAQQEIAERKQAEKELAEAQNDLKKHIHTRTLRLEKANQNLELETRQKENAQIALENQKDILQQVLDTNPTLIYVRDREGRYTLVNEAAAKFEGLAVQDIVGKLVSELHNDSTQVSRWRHEDLQVLDNHREIVLSEERVKDTHGGEHYFQTIKRPILNRKGEAGQVLGVSVDITPLIRAEELAIKANIELAQAYDATIEGWSRALDYRDHETEGHSKRVMDMTIRLAKALGFMTKDLENIKRGAWLHDIGKVGIPDSILLKANALTQDEWKTMRTHPTIGYEILRPISYLHPALDIPRFHHEKWDGSGYPDKLSGETIPLAARIFAIVDVWDALSTDRPYRTAWERSKVMEYIQSNSGKHFDPNLVDVFVKNFAQIVPEEQA